MQARRAHLFVVLLIFPPAAAAQDHATPLPLPRTIRVQSAAPRSKVWESLSSTDKQLVFHLTEAAHAGRALLFHRGHRHAIAVKHVLEAALSAEHLQDTKTLLGDKAFAEFLLYAAKFLDQGGPYAPSNRKYILSEVTPGQIEKLVARHLAQADTETRGEMIRLLTDPKYEVQQYPENPQGEGLELTGGNCYQKGITGKEVHLAFDKTAKLTLNGRVERSPAGLANVAMTTASPGLVGESLRKVVAELEVARAFSQSAYQKAQIDSMIKYFREGDVEDFRQASIAWVRDRSASRVDFMIGWVEFIGDWLSQMASWESYVQIVDPEVSKIGQGLAGEAQYFENAMPYGAFKKQFPPGYTPPAIMVYYFQEISAFRSGGYNLPNFDDIRRDVGAKNVIRLPMPGEEEDPVLREARKAALEQFLPADKVAAVLAHRPAVWRNIVLMHEIIGHGSGTYDTSKYAKAEDPVSALGALGSALEEQRADLTALMFAGDTKLVAIGAIKDEEQARSFQRLTYDAYVGDFLQRASRDRSFAEMHQRGHWLFINKLLEAGAIRWVARDGGEPTPQNQVLAVTDYDKFHKVGVDLLAELQVIKANRDDAALKTIFEKYAPLDAIGQPWAQALIARGADLLINAGYVEQPWRITPDGKFESFGGTTLESIAPYWKRAPIN
jgi:dipeptidyl-peptidase-3